MSSSSGRRWRLWGQEREGADEVAVFEPACGCRTGAVVTSLVATCRANGIDPSAYLRAVLTKLPTHPRTRLWELTPRGWQAAATAAPPLTATSP